jgi:hypothetical protein
MKARDLATAGKEFSRVQTRSSFESGTALLVDRGLLRSSASKDLISPAMQSPCFPEVR